MVRSLNTIEMIALLSVGIAGAIALFNGALPGSWLSVAIVFAATQVIWIVVRDIGDFVIPDVPIVALTLTGAVVRLGGAGESWQSELVLLLVDGALCGGAFLVIREAFFRIRGYDGMGFGDVKLAAASGLFVGMQGFAWSVLAASALGLIVALVLPVLRPGRKLERLPFGAFLAPACWSIWVVQIWSAA